MNTSTHSPAGRRPAFRDALLLRHALHDLRAHRGVTAALATLLVLSAMLMATGAMVMERLVGGVDALFDQARPPHFLQMHKGEYDRAALEAFAAGRPEIDTWLIEQMVGFDGAAIQWTRADGSASGDLSSTLIDNLFVVQNADFDLLIDQTGAVVRPGQGQVYVPVAHQQTHDLAIGDALTVVTASGPVEFTIAGFVRDAQMASSLSSATRFVISDDDFARLGAAGGGDAEIIVEYRLTDTSKVGAFQQAYEADPTTPKNGQAVTYSMIRLVNAISDGLVAVVLMFVSLLLITIAVLNVRFVCVGPSKTRCTRSER